MSSIRVTYSGLISFAVGIISVFTGLIFTLIITRQLVQDDFGTWSVIGSLTGYALILSPMITFWATREISRGKESGKTAIVSSSLFAGLALIIYLVIVYFFNTDANIEKSVLLFAALLIPTDFFKNVLVSINLGYRPHVAEYGLLIFEIAKITFALAFLYLIDMGIEGVIIAISLSSLSSGIFLYVKTYEKIKGKLNFHSLKKWIKLSWIPTYPNLVQVITNSDVIIFTLITGSVAGVAYWSAARAISRVVHHSIKINKAVYPKLLSGGKKEFFEENVNRVFYFAFPLAALSVSFAEPALFALNPIYQVATPIVIILVPLIFIRTLGDIFTRSLSGIEDVDTKENATYKEYMKSKLFFLPTLRNIQRAGYIVSLAIMLLIFSPYELSDETLVMYWAIIAIITQVPYTIYLSHIAKRDFNPRYNYSAITKYGISSIVSFGITYMLMNEYLVYKESIFEFLPELLSFVLIGIAGYLGLTYLIDKKTRKLIKSIFNELKGLTRN